MSRGWRRLGAAGVLALALLVPAAGRAQAPQLTIEVSASIDRVLLTAREPIPIRLEWRVQPPTFADTVISPGGEFETADGRRLSRGFGPALRRSVGEGLEVVFPEQTSIPPAIIVEAQERGSDSVVMTRKFDASVGGESVVWSMASVRLEIVPPQIELSASASPTEIDPCVPAPVVVRWSFEVEDSGPLDVVSEQGIFETSGGQRLGVVPEVLSARGLTAGRTLTETLLVPPEVLEQAFSAASPQPIRIRYRRVFSVGAKGFSRFSTELEGEVDLTVEVTAPQVTVSPASTQVPFGEAASVLLTWRSMADSCRQLRSTAGQFLTPAGDLIEQVPTPIVLTGNDASVERLQISLALATLAVERGLTGIRYCREFSDTRFGDFRVQVCSSIVLGREPEPGRCEIERADLAFAGGERFRLIDAGGRLGAEVELTYRGTCRLRANWEIADPVTTGGAPVFRVFAVVDELLVFGETATMESPPLPTDEPGTYLLRFRILEPGVAPRAVGAVEVGYEVADTGCDWTPPRVPIESELGPPPRDPPPIGPGDPVVDREIVVLSGSLAEAVQLERLGLDVKERYHLRNLRPAYGARDGGVVVTVLRGPAGDTEECVVEQLRRSYPRLWIDANHLYSPLSNHESFTGWDPGEAARAIGWGSEQRDCVRRKGRELKIGLIDTRIEHPQVTCRFSFTSGRDAPVSHGTAVAEILIGQAAQAAAWTGLLPDTEVCAAEVVARRSGGVTGFLRGVAELVDIARALDKLAGEGVRLINFGVGGRYSLLLQRMLEDWAPRQGLYVVAPYGPGPNRYPADYENVLGVSSAGQKVLSDFSPLAVPLGDIGEQDCGASCAAPFATAAVAVLLTGPEPGRPELQRTLSGGGRQLRAPRCDP